MSFRDKLFNSNFFLLLLITLLPVCRGQAQTNVSRAVDRLQRYQLITPREKKLLLEKYSTSGKMGHHSGRDEEPDYSRRYILLDILVQAKMLSTSGTSSLMSFIAAPASSRNLPPAAIHAELDTFIQRLDRAGLLSDQTKINLVRMNTDGRLGWEIEAAEVSFYAANQEYFLRPEKLKQFADRLRSTNVLSEANYRLLMEKSRQGNLHRYSELPAYLDFSTAIATPKLPRDTMSFLHALYAATSRVYPGLTYDSIRFRVEKDKDSLPDFQTYHLVTTIWVRDKLYTYSAYYYAEFKNNPDSLPPVPESYYTLFNKVLADQSSPYRLHAITNGRDLLGVIALTQDQFKQFGWSYDGALSSYVEVSYEKYNNTLTQETIRATVRTYDSLGLFSHLSRVEKDSCMAEVAVKELNYYSDILKCFKNLVLDLDAKYGIDSGQYADITRQAALISKGAFQPDKIVDGYTFGHPNFTYGFTLHNKGYAASLHQESKYLDSGFWSLIDSAEHENNPAGRFYNIYPSDGLTEIYLTNEQYEFLQSHRLLEFTDPDN
jgi:hypothetical protein